MNCKENNPASTANPSSSKQSSIENQMTVGDEHLKYQRNPNCQPLPKISVAFPRFRDMNKMYRTHPYNVKGGPKARIAPNKAKMMLERIYNVSKTPQKKINPKDNTSCTYSTKIISTARLYSPPASALNPTSVVLDPNSEVNLRFLDYLKLKPTQDESASSTDVNNSSSPVSPSTTT